MAVLASREAMVWRVMCCPPSASCAVVADLTGGETESASGANATTTEGPLPMTRPASGQGDHLGRSPDLRVDAWPGLPTVPCTEVTSSDFARRLQLRGQSRPWRV